MLQFKLLVSHIKVIKVSKIDKAKIVKKFFWQVSEMGSKNRILDIYVRLGEGKIINKAEEANKFGVKERSIQRDIDDIRTLLDERKVQNSADNRTIVYNRAKRGFVMKGSEGSLMSYSEILAISKILLASRAFSKKQLHIILDKLVRGCVPEKNRKLVTDLIANETYHYVEVQKKEDILEDIWKIGEWIGQCRLIEIIYKDVHRSEKQVVLPVGILFSEFYFYMNAYVIEKEEGEYIIKNNIPKVFRIDLIQQYKKIDKTIRLDYGKRFEVGEFRNCAPFMCNDKLIKVQFRYVGKKVEEILNYLPTAKIVSKIEREIENQMEKEYIIEVNIYGIKPILWLLIQGNKIEVLRPSVVRGEIKQMLLDILKQYDSGIE